MIAPIFFVKQSSKFFHKLKKRKCKSLSPQENQNKEYEDQAYKIYDQERNAALKTKVEISGRYEKMLLMVTGGALVLSLTFLEKILPNPIEHTRSLLVIAWFTLAISLLACLFSLFASQLALDQFIVNLDNNERERQNSNDKPSEKIDSEKNRWSDIVVWLNRVSLFFAAIGIVFLIIFASCNYTISSQAERKIMNNKQKDEPTSNTNITIINSFNSESDAHEGLGSYKPPTQQVPPPPPKKDVQNVPKENSSNTEEKDK